uniref:Uncharacterized protein n=1 Tax=Cacopsylla melanoneura TaxID=428564 RepID=A0A8D8QI91_9HEMI
MGKIIDFFYFRKSTLSFRTDLKIDLISTIDPPTGKIILKQSKRFWKVFFLIPRNEFLPLFFIKKPSIKLRVIFIVINNFIKCSMSTNSKIHNLFFLVENSYYKLPNS